MTIIDFTHVIEPGMPVYPGTEAPRLKAANTYETDGFRETLLEMTSHTGTHMDAPAHLFANRPTLDRLPAAQFVGKGLVIDCDGARAGSLLGMDRIAPVRAAADQADFLLFRTGWDQFWGREAYYGDYPVIAPDVVDYLIASGKQGVGLDTIGVDPIADESLPIHRRLLDTGKIVILENLTNLVAAGPSLFTFCALPLKFRDADGSPIRAIGILE